MLIPNSRAPESTWRSWCKKQYTSENHWCFCASLPFLKNVLSQSDTRALFPRSRAIWATPVFWLRTWAHLKFSIWTGRSNVLGQTGKPLQCVSHVEWPKPPSCPDLARVWRAPNIQVIAKAFSGRTLTSHAPLRAGMNCILLKLRWLFWNVRLHSIALKAFCFLACVCVECKKKCVL